jgi:hypothetical protein
MDARSYFREEERLDGTHLHLYSCRWIYVHLRAPDFYYALDAAQRAFAAYFAVSTDTCMASLPWVASRTQPAENARACPDFNKELT